MKVNKITVIGAGSMGAGIAQRASQSGFEVSMMDIKEEFLERGFETIKKTLDEGIKRGKVKEEKAKKILENIKGTTNLKEAVEGSNLVIEAVFEDLNVKKELFKELDEICDKDTILATNTSSLSVTELAGVTNRPDRFVGLHFFYPAAINKLVEVISGKDTSEDVMDTLMDVSRTMSKVPIRAKDSPGFVVNRFFVPWLNESCRILEDGMANIPTIDHAAKQGFKIGMGPFKLMNVTGVPIAYHSISSLNQGLGEFYKPSQKLKEQFESGNVWDLEGEIEEANVQKVIDRLFGVIFGVSCHLVEENVAGREDTDRGATIGLRWKAGPFSMMNHVGIKKSLELVQDVVDVSKGTFILPESLKAQADSNKWWDLKTFTVKRDGKIAIITINRPEALNALNSKVLFDLSQIVDEVQKDEGINAVIITGEGNAFVAGADIKEMMKKTPIEAREFTMLGQQVFNKIERMDKPVIAAVNGMALGGGCELALACDMILASKKAKLGFPEVGLGIHPGFGGTQRLPRLIGKAKAKELIFTTDILNAEEAERIGLVNKVVPSEELTDTAMSMASKMTAQGPIALKLAKSAINKGTEMDLDAGLAYEIESVSLTFSTEDSKEGMNAFTERRKPNFKGK
jgi:enoyl-CoA hydratase/3-hydroxyacyl-CoA dehydrogenase